MTNKKFKPKLDRWDIINNLPRGGLTKIAKKCNCSIPHTKHILEGKRTDHSGVIKEAELVAAVNIWKTRFCKLAKSQL